MTWRLPIVVFGEAAWSAAARHHACRALGRARLEPAPPPPIGALRKTWLRSDESPPRSAWRH